MKIRYILLGTVLLLSSCGTIKEYEGRKASIGCNIIQCPTIAELDVQKERISGSVEWKEKWFGRGIPVQVRKGNLIAETTMQAHADILVEPHFILEQGSRGFRSCKLSVSGYPATFKNFRPAATADIELLKLDDSCRNVKPAEKYETRIIKRGIEIPFLKSRPGKK